MTGKKMKERIYRKGVHMLQLFYFLFYNNTCCNLQVCTLINLHCFTIISHINL